MVPQQLTIMRWLTTHLEGATGPWTDDGPEDAIKLTGNVLRGRKFFSDEEFKDLGVGEAVLSILEAPRPLIGETGGVERTVRKENWTLLLQGWARDTKKHPSDPAYWLKAAVEKQLALAVALDSQGEPKYPEYFRMGGLVNELLVGQGLVRPPEQAITRYTMFYIPLIIDLATDLDKPYLLT